MWHTVLHFFGIDNTSGYAYAWWSGAGSDVGEITLLGLLAATLRKHNCEVHACWRMGRHQTAAGHLVCRRHHPDDHLTLVEVQAAHDTAKGGTP